MTEANTHLLVCLSACLFVCASMHVLVYEIQNAVNRNYTCIREYNITLCSLVTDIWLLFGIFRWNHRFAEQPSIIQNWRKMHVQRRCLKCSTTISVCILRFCVHVIVSSANFSILCKCMVSFLSCLYHKHWMKHLQNEYGVCLVRVSAK